MQQVRGIRIVSGKMSQVCWTACQSTRPELETSAPQLPSGLSPSPPSALPFPVVSFLPCLHSPPQLCALCAAASWNHSHVLIQEGTPFLLLCVPLQGSFCLLLYFVAPKPFWHWILFSVSHFLFVCLFVFWSQPFQSRESTLFLLRK